ncbi:MAG: glycosyltransferase [Candidatus Aminicenantes bacterium]|nr:glycosyltransferase [Candidatus Aminicenantes bacterium]
MVQDKKWSFSLRSLHIDNIANVAYANCKLLDQIDGNEVTLSYHNNTHLMSQPEWDDLEIDPENFPDENNFFNNSEDFSDYQLKNWINRDTLLTHNHPSFVSLGRYLPLKLKNRIRPAFLTTMRMIQNRRDFSIPFSLRGNLKDPWKSRCDNLSKISRTFDKRWHISSFEFDSFYKQSVWVKKYLKNKEIVFSYALSPIYSMILGNHPFISVEIGTMRNIPFENSLIGKALALAYRLSPHILITNPDVKSRAEKLGIERFSFCPHPVDEDIYKPLGPSKVKKLRMELIPEHKNKFILFSPARQNWGVKGNDKLFIAFAKAFKTKKDVLLIIPGWGQEVKRSKTLCNKLGLTKNISWINPIPEPLMVKYFQISDLVLDQFQLGVFGLITSKALSCGKPVITSYSDNINSWCFKERPPVLSANSTDEISHSFISLYKQKNSLRKISIDSRKWIENHHSKEIVVNILLASAEKAREYFKKGNKI